MIGTLRRRLSIFLMLQNMALRMNFPNEKTKMNGPFVKFILSVYIEPDQAEDLRNVHWQGQSKP